MLDRYLLRNKEAGFLGNSPMFWRINDCGYTQWIDEAKLFTKEEVDEIVKSDVRKWEKMDASKVFSIAKRTIDIQDWQKLEASNEN